MTISTQSKVFRLIIISTMSFGILLAWRHFKLTQISPADELVQTYGESIEWQCSSLILREALISKTIQGTEAEAFAQTPELAAELEKVAPNFLFNNKETHEKLFRELPQIGDMDSQKNAAVLTPKLKKILFEQKNLFYEQCLALYANIWNDCKAKNDDITAVQVCFQKKAIEPDTVEELTTAIRPRAINK